MSPLRRYRRCGGVLSVRAACLAPKCSRPRSACHALCRCFCSRSALALWRACSSERRFAPFLSGLLMGIAFLMKQHAVFFVAFGGFMLIWQDWRSGQRPWRVLLTRAVFYLIGALAPFLTTLAILDWYGVLRCCLFWTFTYASSYVSQVPLTNALPALLDALNGHWQEHPPLGSRGHRFVGRLA